MFIQYICMNIFKRLKLYYFYHNTIMNNKDILNELGYSIDWFGKIGKMVKIPEGKIPADFLTRTKDIDMFAKSEVNNEMKVIRSFLTEIGLMELVKVYKVKRVERFTSEMQLGFSLINTNIFGKGVLYSTISLIALTLLIFLINFLISINILLIITSLSMLSWIIILIVMTMIYIGFKSIKDKLI